VARWVYCTVFFTSLRFHSPRIVVARSGDFLLGKRVSICAYAGPADVVNARSGLVKTPAIAGTDKLPVPRSALSTVGIRVGSRLEKGILLADSCDGLSKAQRPAAAIQNEQHTLGSPELSSALLHVIIESLSQSRLYLQRCRSVKSEQTVGRK